MVADKSVLPTYKLDSNLVLLPGIVYNLTFTRFKAAALLSRFKDQVTNVPIITDLLKEYDFINEDDDAGLSKSEGDGSSVGSPVAISEEAIEGIRRFVEVEKTAIKRDGDVVASSDAIVVSSPANSQQLEQLVLAVVPNLSKINDPKGPQPDQDKVVTVCRIVGIVDDTTSIKLSLQSLVRGFKVDNFKPRNTNERLIEYEWNYKVSQVDKKYLVLDSRIQTLFKAVDKFVIGYQNAVTTAKDNKNGVNGKRSGPNDLLMLHPLANALYLQLAGSSEFNKAYGALRKLLDSYNNGLTKINPRSYTRLIDLIAAVVPFPNYSKLSVLKKVNPEDRSEEVIRLIEDITSVFGMIKDNNQRLNHWFFNEASNMQMANIVATQLKSIRLVLEGMTNSRNDLRLANQHKSNITSKGGTRDPKSGSGTGNTSPDSANKDDLDEVDDDLQPITEFITKRLPQISSITSDSKRLLVKDYKRIKNSPPGNSDYHVLRNYLEVVVDMPWDKFITKFKLNKDIDIHLAQKQLDEDHYGLTQVKRRLIQYLVVLKLLGINADKEIAEKAEAKRKSITSTSTSSSSSATSDNPIILGSSGKEVNPLNSSASSSPDCTEDESAATVVSKHNKSPIIMLAGPPGTGKTSLAKSIAKSLGRSFQRISLGGINNESEIRGHRRTYIGAMPGMIIQALRKARSMNPVILLDEVDKIIGGSPQLGRLNGDPAAALLEVLDPEQNTLFTDHYLGFPVDLSQVMFICTANEPYNLSAPLLDRLEMIEVDAYDLEAKVIIGENYLLPRQIGRNGFPYKELVTIDKATMKVIIDKYTREAGVRNLERRLGTICRFKAVEYAQLIGETGNVSRNLHTPSKALVVKYDPVVHVMHLTKYLGSPHPEDTSTIMAEVDLDRSYGVVNGLSYNSDGTGSVLVFESLGIEGNSSLHMTGRLGEVLMESAQIGLTYVKSLIYGLRADSRETSIDKDKEEQEQEVHPDIERMKNLEIHLHVPLGAISKDGPSAGIAMALLFLSLILKKPVPMDIAMTGEISLRGMVLPIGGVKEKLMGCCMSKGMIKRVILPRSNRRDVILEYIRQKRGEDDDDDGDAELGELLDDDSRYRYERHEPERFFQQKHGLSVGYAREFKDVVGIVWGTEALVGAEPHHQKLLEYHL